MAIVGVFFSGPGHAEVAVRATDLAKVVEGCLQVFGNHHCTTAFDMVALEEMNEATILEQGDSGG